MITGKIYIFQTSNHLGEERLHDYDKQSQEVQFLEDPVQLVQTSKLS